MFKGYRHTLLNTEPTFNPRQLFAAGEQGVWYDPSDWTTLFQDSAGTTPVTAIEQPVGLILDKSERGNHASQPTTTSRPILRNRYNLLQYTEQFDNAAWAGNSTDISANATTAPDGTLTADKFLCTEAGALQYRNLPFTSTSIQYVFSLYAKSAGEGRYLGLAGFGLGAGGEMPVFDLDNGTYDSPATTTIFKSASIAPVGDGWYRCSVTVLATSGATSVGPTICQNATDNTLSNYNFTGNNTGFFIWGASLVVANESHLPYQWVTTGGAAGYDTDVTKFPPYLFFDGSDDWLSTANIDFSATDKMSVFAGVRKLSDSLQ